MAVLLEREIHGRMILKIGKKDNEVLYLACNFLNRWIFPLPSVTYSD